MSNHEMMYDKTGNLEPVLVLGGTGHYGRHIVASLRKRGAPVRVLSRHAAPARQLLGEEVEILEGDITSRASVAEALTGARGMVIAVSAFNPQQIRQVEAVERDAVLAVVVEAERMGVARAVYLSVYDIRQDVVEDLDLESGLIKAAIEAALAGSGLNWTVLGCAPSMQLFFAMIRGEIMVVPGGGPPALPTISPVDVGEIAAQAVLRDDLSGRRFRLVGPEAISFPEAARRIAAVTGKPLQFRKIPLILPKIASILLTPLAPFSDRIAYVSQMLGFIKLLNAFPVEMAAEAAQAHQQLRETFDYTPTTLEMEAERRCSAQVQEAA